MTPPPAGQRGSWVDHREWAEKIGEAVANAMSTATGTNVELGVGSSCDPDDLVKGKPLPLHAIIVNFRRPLDDVMIFISPLKEDAMSSLVAAAAVSTLKALEVPTGSDEQGPLGQFGIEEAVEFTTVEEALEQCDALYLEAVYSLEVPNGEIQMVLGTALLEAAAALHATEDEEAVEQGPTPLKVGLPGLDTDAAMPSGAGGSRYQFGDGDMRTGEAEGLGMGDAQFAPGEQLENLDAMLAAQEAEAARAAGLGGADDGYAIGADEPDLHATERWTQLLSGVEVELSAELGRAQLALHEITSLDAASVLTLDQMVEQPVTVYVNGTPYATARLVVVDGEYGIEIIEVVDQTTLFDTLAA